MRFEDTKVDKPGNGASQSAISGGILCFQLASNEDRSAVELQVGAAVRLRGNSSFELQRSKVPCAPAVHSQACRDGSLGIGKLGGALHKYQLYGLSRSGDCAF